MADTNPAATTASEEDVGVELQQQKADEPVAGAVIATPAEADDDADADDADKGSEAGRDERTTSMGSTALSESVIPRAVRSRSVATRGSATGSGAGAGAGAGASAAATAGKGAASQSGVLVGIILVFSSVAIDMLGISMYACWVVVTCVVH